MLQEFGNLPKPSSLKFRGDTVLHQSAGYDRCRVPATLIIRHHIVEREALRQQPVGPFGLRRPLPLYRRVAVLVVVVFAGILPEPVVLASNYVAYTDPTDQPNVHHAPLYVAALFPNGPVETKRLGNHAVGVVRNYRGEPFTYYFGSAWSKHDVRTSEEWLLRIAWFLRSVENPLQVTMKKN